MKIDADKIYQMPLIAGPRLNKGVPIPYPKVEGLAVQYKTTREAIAELLPDCYEPAEEPEVTIIFGYNDELAFMAGGGYRLATVQVAARFDGEVDHVDGDYILVMFEDHTIPIIGGRELLGVPKLYADISSIKSLPVNRLRCEASLWGHLLFGIEVPALKKQNPVVRTVANRQFNERPWLGYKFIDRLDGPPDADYATITRNDIQLNELWLGDRATIYFGDATGEDVSGVAPVLAALRKLPMVQVKRTVRYRGSAVLRYDQSRQLR